MENFSPLAFVTDISPSARIIVVPFFLCLELQGKVFFRHFDRISRGGNFQHAISAAYLFATGKKKLKSNHHRKRRNETSAKDSVDAT